MLSYSNTFFRNINSFSDEEGMKIDSNAIKEFFNEEFMTKEKNYILKSKTNYFCDKSLNILFNNELIDIYHIYKLINSPIKFIFEEEEKYTNIQINENSYNDSNENNNITTDINALEISNLNPNDNCENNNKINTINFIPNHLDHTNNYLLEENSYLNNNNNDFFSSSNDNFNDSNFNYLSRKNTLNSNLNDNNIKFKTKKITETYENPKSRKLSKDLQIKKHKGKFFRYIRKILNQILIKNKKKDKFDYFPKILKEGLDKNEFKKILELKLIDFINFEIIEGITNKIEISEINKRLYELLKDKQEEKFQLTLKDLHEEYLNSEQYKDDINKINNLKLKYDNEYMDSYKKTVENFINYYFKDN